MRYLCTNCNYIYDEGSGDMEESIESGTRIDEIENFSCPCCDATDLFQEIKEEVNYIDDDNMFFMEQEHYINYEIIKDKNSLFGEILKITIGKEDLHPMGEDHFIKSVSLYDSDGELIEEKFLKESDDAIVEFDYDSIGEFEIRLACSLHGVWGRKIDL